MRVLMTADAVGGVWGYSLELASALAAHGVAVTVATMGPAPDAAQRAALLAIPGARHAHGDFGLEWMQDPWDDVARAGDWLLALAARERPDLVHVNGYAHAALPFDAPVACVAHSCVCSWWEGVHGGDAPREWDRYREAVRAGVAAADVVVAPTRAMLDALVRHHGAPREARVIPNARRLPPSVAAARRRPVVLAAGRLWDEAKNAALLARVAPHVAWPVELAGDCTRPDGARRTLAGVRCLGRLDARAMARAMGTAGLFAHPALYEPFGLAPLEAALAGCPLLLADIPSLRETWGDAAEYADPRDEHAWVEAIAALVADPARREGLAARAAARARAFAPEAQAAAYLDTYRAMAGASKEALACAS